MLAGDDIERLRLQTAHRDADERPAVIVIFGDGDPAATELPVDFIGPGNGRAAFANVLADAALEIADCARVFAVLQGVLVSRRRTAARPDGQPDLCRGRYRE